MACLKAPAVTNLVDRSKNRIFKELRPPSAFLQIPFVSGPIMKNVRLRTEHVRSIRTSAPRPTCTYVSAEDPIDVVASIQNNKVLVLGGNGFVGTAVCRAAIAQGIEVVSLNRSGPPSYTEGWVQEVQWVRGDVFRADWPSLMAGVSSVVSCIGGFGSNEAMERICGDATIAAVDGAAGVSRFVFVSVHNYNLPEFALSNGYFNGKRRAEVQVLANFPTNGVVLRPGFIYGKRRVNTFDIPLDVLGKPLEMLLEASRSFTKPLQQIPGSDLLLAPPISVEDVGSAVVACILRKDVFGVVDIEGIKRFAKSVPDAYA